MVLIFYGEGHALDSLRVVWKRGFAHVEFIAKHMKFFLHSGNIGVGHIGSI